MIRRRTLLSSALAASAAWGLAACGNDPASTGSASTSGAPGGASDGDVLSQVTIGGDVGAEPTVSFTAPLAVTGPEAKVVTPGDGEQIADGDFLALQTMYVDAQDGSTLQSSWQGGPAGYLAVNAADNGQETAAFLTGITLGSRIAMLGTIGNQSGTTYDVVQVSDIVGKALARAEGTAQALPDGMGAVTLAADGAPQLAEPPTLPAPATTARALTIQGTGAQTAAGDELAMHYTGWKLSDGTQFDSSWERGVPFSFTLGAGQVISGWDQGLLDTAVGSQVLLVIPPGEAYGGSTSELAEETLIFVADVLGATTPAGS